MTAPQTRQEHLVDLLANAALIGIALLPALVYLFVGLSSAGQLAADDARIQAERLSRVIASNPEGWRFAQERLIDQIAAIQRQGELSSAFDNEGKALIPPMGDPCRQFCLTHRAPLLDFGNVVGELRLETDITPIVVRSAIIGILGLLTGLLLVRALHYRIILPLRQARITNIELAFRDPLTHLPNRRLLMDRLEQALRASERTSEYGALLLLDLDNFKILNDTLGHDVGDQLLLGVAQRLKDTVREHDTVARLGGDEYVVILENMGQHENEAANRTEIVSEKIRGIFAAPFVIATDGRIHHSTASIGIALFRGQELAMEVLLKQADLALYQAKASGRNAVRFFNAQMQAAIDTHLAMEAALREAIHRCELQLHYQPQIDHCGKLLGAEALLRWFPDGQVLVPPDKFIPLAEETGLILPIGRWVLQTACEQLKVWASEPAMRDLRIAVNVSARQFHQAQFVDDLRNILLATGADPTRLELELTESIVLQEVDEAIRRMRQIKQLGVTFSLDDFGTGYSSLSYLKQLPLDQIKIDRSFVRDIGTDTNDSAIVRAIIVMANSLGLEIVAEGVETRAQLEFLQNCGCTTYQGFLLGKPMPIEAWPDYLTQNTRGLFEPAEI
jgi:diguanylate cyclase (GGDEF)-like protein